MKNNFVKIILFLILVLFVAGMYYTHPAKNILFENYIFNILLFVSGITLGVFIMQFFLDKSSNALKAYKRELEKESISSTESSSQIKVLESKIEVLEKALKQALGK